jgi:DNA end-binding protein Ku
VKDDVKVSPQELKMTSSLIDNMSADFAPDKFSDEYQDQLRQLIAAKLEQGDALDTAATFGEKDEEKADRGEVVDLMEALRRSVDQNRAARKTAETKPSAKQPTARKAPAKKAAAKKAPAKKGAAKKATTAKSAKKAS